MGRHELTIGRLFAVCGSLTNATRVSVRDNGDGTCTAMLQQGAVSQVADCSSQLFNQNCDTLQAAVTLVFAAKAAWTYRQSMSTWLKQLGLGAVTVIARPLTIYVEHAPTSVPQFLYPDFFRSLTQVGAPLQIDEQECWSRSAFQMAHRPCRADTTNSFI